jgi:hypothetical protein
MTLCTLTPLGLDVLIVKLYTVVVGKLFALFNVALRHYIHVTFINFDFTVWSVRMVNVARRVRAVLAVYRYRF